MDAKKFELRDQPAYALAEAARYLKLPAATLRSWTFGRPYPKAGKTVRFQPLIRLVEDYGLTSAEIEEAVLYERAA